MSKLQQLEEQLYSLIETANLGFNGATEESIRKVQKEIDELKKRSSISLIKRIGGGQFIEDFGEKTIEWEYFRCIQGEVLKERILSTGTTMVLVRGVCWGDGGQPLIKTAWHKICPFDGVFELGRGFTSYELA